jgi:ribosome-associated protein
MNAKTILSMIIHEVTFKYFTASGPGGQNLQKNKSGVQLFWNINESGISEELKEKVRRVNRSTKEAYIVQFKSQTERSLDMNKKNAIQKLQKLLELALYVPKERRATKPTRSSIRKRLESKKVHKDIKSTRKKVSDW